MTNGSNGDIAGTAASPADPGLDPNGLQNNGGPTQTIALTLGSQAVNHADPATCLALAGNFDQRGDTRAADTRHACDIGAFDTAGAEPTASLLTRLAITHRDGVVRFRWTAARRTGIAGFMPYAGAHALAPRMLPLHRSADYRFSVDWNGSGPFRLEVVLRDGGAFR